MKCCAHKEQNINVIVFPNKLPDSSLPVRTYETKEKRRSVWTLHLPDRNTNFSLWIKKMIWTSPRNYKTSISDAEHEASRLSDSSRFDLSRLTDAHRSCIHPDVSHSFTHSCTEIHSEEALCIMFLHRNRHCWLSSARTRCHRPSLSLESHFLIYLWLGVCPWLRDCERRSFEKEIPPRRAVCFYCNTSQQLPVLITAVCANALMGGCLLRLKYCMSVCGKSKKKQK